MNFAASASKDHFILRSHEEGCKRSVLDVALHLSVRVRQARLEANRGPAGRVTRLGLSMEHQNGEWLYNIQGLQQGPCSQYRVSRMKHKSDGGETWKFMQSVGTQGENNDNYPLLNTYVDQGPRCILYTHHLISGF